MELTNENRIKIRTIFKEMRNNLSEFMTARSFEMSNAQIFTFLTYSPAVLAIASDGTVDESEIASLERMARAIDVKSAVNVDLQEMMAVAFEPDEPMTNEEFNLRAGSELLFLSRNSKTHEASVIGALKAMLVFDTTPSAPGSLTSSFSSLMDSMIENNKSENKEGEKKKIDEIKAELGM